MISKQFYYKFLLASAGFAIVSASFLPYAISAHADSLNKSVETLYEKQKRLGGGNERATEHKIVIPEKEDGKHSAHDVKEIIVHAPQPAKEQAPVHPKAHHKVKKKYQTPQDMMELAKNARSVKSLEEVYQNAPVVNDEPQRYTSYILGPGDKLKITVFGEDDLSGEYAVNDAGQVSYPLIGEIDVSDYTVLEVKDRVVQLLSSGYLKDPNVGIEVVEFRPFYIMGEVGKPGSYDFAPNMNILNAVALAGGFTFRAEKDEVEIYRTVKGESYILKDLDPKEKVIPGDLILIKERFF